MSPDLMCTDLLSNAVHRVLLSTWLGDLSAYHRLKEPNLNNIGRHFFFKKMVTQYNQIFVSNNNGKKHPQLLSRPVARTYALLVPYETKRANLVFMYIWGDHSVSVSAVLHFSVTFIN